MQVDESTVLLALIVAITASIVVGNVLGRRKVDSVTMRLVGALRRLGAEVKATRRTSSMALVSGRGLGELEEFSVLVGLLPRANVLGYLAARLAGRRDLVMLRGAIRKPPKRSVALLRKGTPAVRGARRWGQKVAEVGEFLMVSEGSPPDLDREVIESLSGTSLLLLAVRPELPHVYAYIELGPKLEASLEAAVRAVGAIRNALT
jgi:hypothetical protein